MIFKNTGNSRIFKYYNQKGTIFQGFQGLENTVLNLKYFKALQGPVNHREKETIEYKIHGRPTHICSKPASHDVFSNSLWIIDFTFGFK